MRTSTHNLPCQFLSRGLIFNNKCISPVLFTYQHLPLLTQTLSNYYTIILFLHHAGRVTHCPYTCDCSPFVIIEIGYPVLPLIDCILQTFNIYSSARVVRIDAIHQKVRVQLPAVPPKFFTNIYSFRYFPMISLLCG